MSSKQTTIQRFRRHFHKVADAYDVMAESGSFRLSFEFRDGKGTVSNETPEQETIIRFSTLMRPFVEPRNPIHWESVLECIKCEHPEVMTADRIDRLQGLARDMRRGNFSLVHNGESISAEEIYALICDGQYFTEITEAKRRFESISKGPVVEAMLWNQFWTYNLCAFQVVSELFSLVIEAEHRRFPEQPPRLGPCIYCLSEDQTFTSEEHVVPESLNNRTMILPKGYVCDHCNNGLLAKLDQ